MIWWGPQSVVRRHLVRSSSWLSAWRWPVFGALLVGVELSGLRWTQPRALSFMLAAVAVALLVRDVVSYLAARDQLRFVPWQDGFADVRGRLADDDRFEFLAAASGTMLIDRVLTDALQRDVVAVERREDPYVLPPQLERVGAEYRRRRLAGRTDAYDGDVLGLASDVDGLTPGAPAVVTVQAGKYFDHLASDLLATEEVQAQGRWRTDLGRPLVVDRRGDLRDFGASWLLNAIGVSVLALTTDRCVVVVHQTDRNESSRDQAAPSGSGSLEPRDLPTQGTSFREGLGTGALREMDEEAGIPAGDVVEWEILGFGRWLEKGAKPEALVVARLSIDSHEALRRRSRKQDVRYSKFAEPMRLAGQEAWQEGDVATMFDQRPRAVLSVPLHAGLTLIGGAAAAPGNPVRALLERADVLRDLHG